MNRDIDAYIGETMPLPDEWRQRPEELRTRLKDPYHGCFIYCITTMLSYSVHSASRQNVNVVMAHHPEYSGWANEVYQAMREGEAGGDLLGSLSFDSPVNLVQLQAADLVVYELQHYLTETKYKGKLKSETRWAMGQLLAKPHYFKMVQARPRSL